MASKVSSERSKAQGRAKSRVVPFSRVHMGRSASALKVPNCTWKPMTLGAGTSGPWVMVSASATLARIGAFMARVSALARALKVPTEGE